MEGTEKNSFTEDDIINCKEPNGQWLCPVAECKKTLSRKQTLQSHLASKHSIIGGMPPKRYKLYESDASIPVPKSTKHLRAVQEDSTLSDDITASSSIQTGQLPCTAIFVEGSNSGFFPNTFDQLSQEDMNRLVSDFQDDNVEQEMDLCDSSEDGESDNSINSNNDDSDDDSQTNKIQLGLGHCEKLSEEECRSLGFTPNLMCTYCNMLDDYNLAVLKNDCKKCCQEDAKSDEALKTYPYAELRVCG